MISILAPILLLVLLGLFLARMRFLGRGFMGDLNKLVFWIALPAFLFRSTAHAEQPGPETFSLLALLLTATVIIAAAGWFASRFLRLPLSCGTLSQSAFRGNLAYIGIPVLTYLFDSLPEKPALFATAVITMAALMVAYNILAVIVLSGGARSDKTWRAAFRSIFTNPLLLACLFGVPLALTATRLPLFLDRALEALGGAAVPIALLCIGGSLAHIRLGARLPAIATAALLKTLVLPLAVYCLSPVFGITGNELRVALVFSACPTAAASFVMVRQMNGDESLASGSIVLSAIFALASIPLALLLPC